MNRRFLLLFLLAVGNLLLMHWQLALTVEYEYPFRPDAIWSNVFACLIDTTVFFPVGLLVTWGRVKPALLITFVGTWLLALFNLVYARFFDHYIPTMAVTQVGNLMDGEVAKCILEGFRWTDLGYVALAFLFGWLYVGRKTMERGWWNLGACLKTLGIVWGAMLASVAAFIVVMGLFRDDSFKVSYTRFSPMRMQYYQAPNNMLFRGGFFRQLVVLVAQCCGGGGVSLFAGILEVNFQHVLAQLQAVVGIQDHLAHRIPIYIGAVGAAQVLDRDVLAVEGQAAVLAAHQFVVQADVGIGTATKDNSAFFQGNLLELSLGVQDYQMWV